MRLLALPFALSVLGLAAVGDCRAAPRPPDQVLFRFSGEGLFDGAFGPLHEVEAAAAAALLRCGSKVPMPAAGRMDRGAQEAFRALSACPEVSPKLDPSSEARRGAVTRQLWDALLGEQVPDAAARARTMMLTFEATDYTALEWNYCQSRPLYDPPKQPTCFSNDPHSFVTWGPNGATAGGGREVQAIIGKLMAAWPSSVGDAFGGEADAVRRLIRLDPAGRDTEIYLCGIWALPARREAWRAAFRALGAQAPVRDAYDEVYRSSTFDGGKIAAFARAYRASGLVPTEVDFAFFKDRSAHMGISFDAIAAAVTGVASPTVEHWRVRQAISLHVRPPAQRKDRLGRDVAFYVDGIGQAGLSPEEAAAWTARGSRRASDAGLSDGVPSALAGPGPAIDMEVRDPVALTEGERAACPDAVLRTRRP